MLSRFLAKGSLYNGNAKPDGEWPDANNNSKVLRTRSGHTVILSDEDGKEYIKIYDCKDKNAIKFNPVDEELKLYSAGNIILQGKNILLSAWENIEMKADGEILLNTKKDVKTEAEGSISQKATQDIKAEGMNVEIKGSMETKISGMQAELSGTATTTIKGGIVKIN